MPFFLCMHLFSFEQPVYKQLALGCQIGKHLSGLNPLLLSNNKNFRLNKSFSYVINVKQLLNRQSTKIQLPQKYYREIFKFTDHKYRF